MHNSAKKYDKNSEEYIKIENETLNIFKKLADNVPDNVALYRYLFDELGFKTQTLAVFTAALNKPGKAGVPYLPDDD